MRTPSPPVYWYLIVIYPHNLKQFLYAFFKRVTLTMYALHTNLHTN